MGTCSDIIAKLSNDTWARIYCHWNGYLEHNGRLLFDHYTDQATVDALLARGDLSSLDSTPPACDAYRDRGEGQVDAETGASLAEVWPDADTWTEFTYVWDGERWFVGNPDEGTQTLVDLGDALMGKTAVTPGVKVFGAVIGQHEPINPAAPQHSWKR